MPEADAGLEPARRAFAARDWRGSVAGFGRAPADEPLGPDDLARWSRSEWWLGHAEPAISLAERAFAGFRDEGRTEDAARSALRISMLHVTGADVTLAIAWMRRAESLLGDVPDGTLHAYLAYLEFWGGMMDGRPDWPASSVGRLRELAQRLRDPAVTALSNFVSGMIDVRSGEIGRGFAQLDETMLAVLSGEIEPEWGGDAFCAIIHTCHDLADHRRMADWTRATEQWCERFGSDAVYAGVCTVHRLELRSASGDWDDVEEALTAVCGRLGPADPQVAGAGWYQLGEVRRLRGDDSGARAAYALARDAGIDPAPGESLLELRRGDPERAWSLLIGALDGTDRLGRTRLLRAGVEIALATARTDAALAFRDELGSNAADFDSAGFRAWADHADGMVALAEGDSEAAVPMLQHALAYFRQHGFRWEQARVLAWLAAAHEAGGDAAQAAHLRAEACVLFDRVGARADLVVARVQPGGSDPLTPREREVLELVAGGARNREIAERLFISEKTVGRHLGNIYGKVGVGSRTAAAAWWREERPARR